MKVHSSRISVVMPSYNHGRFIRESIESVLSQDYPDVDLLVMDGGSTDETLDILKSYGGRISFISQKDNGQSDAINRGLQLAKDGIACWLNSDDLFEPGALSAVAHLFQANPGVEFVYGKGWNIDEQGGIIGCSGVQPFNLWKLIHHRNIIQQPSCFFRKSLLKKVGLIREDLYYVMDWELWIRFGLYKGMFLDQYLSRNRTYAENKTVSGGFRRWREICRMVRTYSDTKYPPVIRLYFAETLLQLLQSMPRLEKYLGFPIRRYFFSGMMREISGWYCDGGASKKFRLAIPNPLGKKQVKLTLRPISAYDRTFIGNKELIITWKASTGELGQFELKENGQSQDFILPFGRETRNGFIYLSCRANWCGYLVRAGNGLPDRRIVGFLDAAECVD